MTKIAKNGQNGQKVVKMMKYLVLLVLGTTSEPPSKSCTDPNCPSIDLKGIYAWVLTIRKTRS